MVGVLEGMMHVQQQGEAGRQRGTQSRLAQLASQAYGAAPGQQRQFVQQAIQSDPQAGFALGKGLQDDRQGQMASLSQKARMLVGFAKSGNRQYVDSLYPQIAAEAQQLGLGQNIPTAWDDSFLGGMEQLANIGGGTQGTGVQSTYVDAQGNRVAILRDGSTQILGQNAPQNQIIDTGNGFFGVNKGSLQAAPVMVGGGAPQQSAPPTGTASHPNQEAVLVQANQMAQQGIPSEQIDNWIQAQLSQPVATQGTQGGQLRSAPKAPAVPSGYRANPDGSLAPIPGGPAQIAIDARADAAAARKAAEDLKASQKQQEANARQAASAEASNQLIAAIDDLTNHPGFADLGTVTGDLKISTPLIRSGAKDADAKLKNVAGQVALATLSKLKTLSSAGATGFGALSAPELTLVQNSIATLQSENISNAEIRRSLKIIRDTMEKAAQWSPPKSGGMHGPAPSDGPAQDDDESLIGKYL